MSLGLLKKLIQTWSREPIKFPFRQLYKLIVLCPVEIVATGLEKIRARTAPADVMPKSFCFIITSVIYAKTGTIQYNSPRSVFSPEDRARQTLETIASIRQKVPGAKIILVESGLRQELPCDLANQVDQYIYVGAKRLVRAACDSPYKSLGEIMMLLCSVKRFAFKADFYFKISGRYYLDEEFDIKAWQQGRFVLQYIQPDYVCTRLYGWRASAFHIWQAALVKSVPLALVAYAVENTLARYIPRDQVVHLERLGVTGVGASSNVVAKD